MGGLRFGFVDALVHSRLPPTLPARSSMAAATVMGADSYWVGDHLNALVPRSIATSEYLGIAAKFVPKIDANYEPWTMLGNLAFGLPSRLRLGVCVTDAGRRNPAVTAQAAATLHLLTRGRAILGIGVGEREGNEPYGVEWTKPVARFEEALATIRALWNSNGELISRESPYFPLHNALFDLPPEKNRLRTVKREVASAISRSHRLRVADVVMVAPGSIPVTTSGKVRRSASVERYLHHEFSRLDAMA